MSTVTESGTRSSGKRVGALILAIVGILLVILAVIYLITAAGSLPSFIPGHIHGSSGHHPLRRGRAHRGPGPAGRGLVARLRRPEDQRQLNVPAACGLARATRITRPPPSRPGAA